MPKQSYTHLSFEERETLSLGLSQGQSLRTMAAVLGRSPSSVSREPARNATQGATVSGLYGAQLGGRPDSSPPAAAQTVGPLAVAVCPNTPDPWVLA